MALNDVKTTNASPPSSNLIISSPLSHNPLLLYSAIDVKPHNAKLDYTFIAVIDFLQMVHI